MANFDARIEAEKVQNLYKSDPNQKNFKLLLFGEGGTGKTNLVSTSRKPIHIDSFDPGGTNTVRKLIDSGDIFADTRYENEDPYNPSAFQLWKNTFELRKKGNYFEQFGTYCLDSSTFWAEAIMHYVMKGDKKGSRAGESPNFYTDYIPQKVLIRNYIRQILELPCNVIVTGHLKEIIEMRGEDNDIPVVTGYKYMTTGDGQVIIPLYFGERYVTTTKTSGSKVEYKLATAKIDKLPGKTGIGNGIFAPYEEADLKKLLKKVNLDLPDKPKLDFSNLSLKAELNGNPTE